MPQVSAAPHSSSNGGRRPCTVRKPSLRSQQPRVVEAARRLRSLSPYPLASGYNVSAAAASSLSARRSAAAPEDGTEEEKTLRAARKLRSLFLCSRGIVSMRCIHHVEHMTNLRALNLHMNLIKHIECPISVRPGLVELDFSANEIQDLAMGCFSGMRQLQRLNLSSNLLSVIPEGVLAPLTALEWLSLGFNDLQDINGLRSIPSSAPLGYVDVCGNCIGSLDHVLGALRPHKDHIRQLRLQAPRATAEVALQVMAQSAVGSAAAPQRLLRENPFCAPGMRPTGYAEMLLEHFPSLTVLDGVSYGLDPLAEAAAQGSAELTLASPSGAAGPLVEDAAEALWWPMLLALRNTEAAAPPRWRGAVEGSRASTPSTTTVANSSSDTSTTTTSTVDTVHRHRGAATAPSQGSTPHLAAPAHKADAVPPSTPPSKSKHRGPSVPPGNATAITDLSGSPQHVTPDLTSNAPEEEDEERDDSSALRQRDNSHGSLVALPAITDHANAEEQRRLQRRVSCVYTSMGGNGVPLNWRPKRVSRGTNTKEVMTGPPENPEQGGMHTDDSSLTGTRLQRVQEQLALRLSIEADLRHRLQLALDRGAEAAAASTARTQRLQAQVAALKDELMRRAQEVTIMQRKHVAEVKERTSAVEAQWRRALSESEATADQLKAQLRATAAHTNERLRLLEEGRNELQGHVSALARECEDSYTRNTELEREQRCAAVAAANYFAAWGVAQFEAAEAADRHRVELAHAEARDNIASCVHAALHSHLTEAQGDRLALLAAWEKHQATWEEYCAEQRAQCDEKVASMRSRCARLSQKLEHAVTEVRNSAEKEEGSAAALQALREQHAQRDAEMARLRETCVVAEETQLLLGHENTRLLAQVEDLKRQIAVASSAEAPPPPSPPVCAEVRERENMLRTIHNLQEDLRRKDDALDALEAEALTKLDEKRRRIAELEGQVELLHEEAEKVARQRVQCRDEMDAAKRAAADAQGSAETLTSELRERLHSLTEQRRQERETLVGALGKARDHLVQLRDSHGKLVKECAEKAAALEMRNEQLGTLRQKLTYYEDASRAKQRATVEALSRMILADANI